MKTCASMRTQRGVAAVEFALVSGIFFTLMLGVIEMGRLLWVWNAAVEATRFGARMAVVCPISAEATVKARMVERLPNLATSNITIAYLDPPATSCTSATCKFVKVSFSNLNPYTHQTIIPFVPLSVTLPPFSTTLRKEYMDTPSNSVCS